MSKSRLEKFLYALYSLDHSDLPIPRSRIEELYNCLVTGAEVPTFEPISRVEKYLMTILGVYSVNELPHPLSRVEVLLYKLATGDDNFDDIEVFLSKHEELLAGIIRNGGINGDISFDDVDYEYSKYSFATGHYTLENTAEQPVKSAVLKGQTLVNINSSPIQSDSDFTNGTLWFDNASNDPVLDKKYFIKLFNHGDYFRECYFASNERINLVNNCYAIITTTNPNNKRLHIYSNISSVAPYDLAVNVKAIICEYQDGMENWDIPYFEGMKSVENPVVTTTGKNLLWNLDPNNPDNNFSSSGNGTTEISYLEEEQGFYTERHRAIVLALKPNTKYTFSATSKNRSEGTSDYIWLLQAPYSASFGEKTDDWERFSYTFTTDSTGTMVLNIYRSVYFKDIQLEEGSVATEYEPYKSTTVTCNEDIVLCSVGEVKDELDLLTGEVTRRVGEVVLNGSEESISFGTTKTITQVYKIEIGESPLSAGFNKKIISDGLPNGTSGDVEKFVVEIYYDYDIRTTTMTIYVALDKTKASTVDEFREYLSKNPLTLLGPARDQTMEAVNLTTKDQDGNNTKLKTFDDITHVTITSEGLVPESEVEVAKYIPYITYALTEKETTLYNTKEHSMKSAVLKGQTLVNLINLENFTSLDILYTCDLPITNNTTYTVIATLRGSDKIRTSTDSAFRIKANDDNGNDLIDVQQIIPNDISTIINLCQTIKITTQNNLHIRLYNTLPENLKLIILEGDHTQEDIPYFEGMKSVENPVITTTGKNLFDLSDDKLCIYTGGDVNTEDHSQIYQISGSTINVIKQPISSDLLGYKLPIKKNIEYLVISGEGLGNALYYRYFGKDFTNLNGQGQKGKFYSTDGFGKKYVSINGSEFPPEAEYILLGIGNDELSDYTMENIQIEESIGATTYEPYKSTTVTCNENVELRDAGDVKDELDCFTGEVTKRVGEVVFDGGEDWTQSAMGDPTIFYTSLNDMAHNKDYTNSISCDKFIAYTGEGSLNNSTILNGITGYVDLTDTYPNENWIYIKLADSEGSVEKLKQWLSQNPVTVHYELTTESVETVDISVVDQDGNNTKLKSFDDITYVTLSSEGAIPEAELEVATKNEEVLSTMSLRMDDIHTAQTTLEETSNTQSENVDATMLATTEIYEGLL